MSMRIGINGAGRIGRILMRALHDDPDVRVAAVNDVAPVATVAHLLRYDSVHGPWSVPVTAETDAIRVGDDQVTYWSYEHPSAIPWDNAGVDVVIEATGRFTHLEDAEQHRASRVVISAVGRGGAPTLVYGVHPAGAFAEQRVIAAGSCTTHAAALPLMLLHRWYGVQGADVMTVHCTTGSQVTMDQPHRDLRRGRAAGVSIIPTTTSANRGLCAALPELADRLNCYAVRVPTASVSLVQITAHLERTLPEPEGLVEHLDDVSQNEQKGRLAVSYAPLVSVDFRGNTHSAVVDAALVECPSAHLVRLVAWYDNEWGYVSRLVDLLRTWQVQ